MPDSSGTSYLSENDVTRPSFLFQNWSERQKIVPNLLKTMRREIAMRAINSINRINPIKP